MQESEVIRRKQPCICGKSSDAADFFSSGLAKCHSGKCNGRVWRWDNGENIDLASYDRRNTGSPATPSMAEILQYKIRGNQERLLLKQAMEFYGVRSTIGFDGNVDRFWFPFSENLKEITGFKSKKVGDKAATFSVGRVSTPFGLEHFSGGGKRIVITEGEEDAIAIQSANFLRYGKPYPVISMGAASQTEFLLKHRDTLKKFEEIILWFDQDEPGANATLKAAKILGFENVKTIKTNCKDANDQWLLLNRDSGSYEQAAQQLVNMLFGAQPYTPTGVLSGEALWDRLKGHADTPSVDYPDRLSGLQEKLGGIRKGEITTIVSGTGTGKSTLTRELVLHLLQVTDSKVGVIALEEGPEETVRKLSAMSLNRNPADPKLSLEELRVGFDSVFGGERVMVLDHIGSASDSRILDLMEFMALSGVEYIVLDHLTIMISEGAGGLEGNAAQDKVMNDLARFVKRYEVSLFLVSHLRKNTDSGKSYEEGLMPSMDAIRGSGSTKQVSMNIIAFARNTLAEDPEERNRARLAVLKCRNTGLTGFAGVLQFNLSTGRLDKGSSSSSVEDQLVGIE